MIRKMLKVVGYTGVGIFALCGTAKASDWLNETRTDAKNGDYEIVSYKNNFSILCNETEIKIMAKFENAVGVNGIVKFRHIADDGLLSNEHNGYAVGFNFFDANKNKASLSGYGFVAYLRTKEAEDLIQILKSNKSVTILGKKPLIKGYQKIQLDMNGFNEALNNAKLCNLQKQ